MVSYASLCSVRKAVLTVVVRNVSSWTLCSDSPWWLLWSCASSSCSQASTSTVCATFIQADLTSSSVWPRRLTVVLGNCTAQTWKAGLTEVSVTFQQDSIFILTCWNNSFADKTRNVFKEKILLEILTALIFHLVLFPSLTSGENKSIFYVNVMLLINEASCSRKFDLCSPGSALRSFLYSFSHNRALVLSDKGNCTVMSFHKHYFSYH